MEIYVGYNPKNSKLVANLVRDEIQKIVDFGVTQAEVDRSVMLTTNSIYMSAEANMFFMRINGRRILKTGKPFDINAEISACKSVSVEDVNRVAKTIFAANPAVAYVGAKTDGDFDAAAKIFGASAPKA